MKTLLTIFMILTAGLANASIATKCDIEVLGVSESNSNAAVFSTLAKKTVDISKELNRATRGNRVYWSDSLEVEEVELAGYLVDLSVGLVNSASARTNDDLKIDEIGFSVTAANSPYKLFSMVTTFKGGKGSTSLRLNNSEVAPVITIECK
tara:strand:+ start:66 stop:518 length:453 start_codon:yes stop_codon:yes gene_type:complete